MDALLQHAKIKSFPELTLSPVFRRGWSSAYKAIEVGKQDRAWLTCYLSQQIPEAGVQVFALDETVWPHPKVRTLAGMLYARSPTKSIKRYGIVKGHVCSILAWVPEAEGSWAPPVDSRRVSAETDAVQTGMQQIDALVEARGTAGQTGLIVVATDGRYSNHVCNRAIDARDEVAKVGRMRGDRTLYREPGPYQGMGRPRKHGAPFRFKDPSTWDTPVEAVTFAHPKFGQVRLRRWDDLHAQKMPKCLSVSSVARPIWSESPHLPRCGSNGSALMITMPVPSGDGSNTVGRLRHRTAFASSTSTGPCPDFNGLNGVTAGLPWSISPIGNSSWHAIG
jgi:hypothetical protein